MNGKTTMKAHDVFLLLDAARLAHRLTKHQSTFKRELDKMLAEKNGYSRLRRALEMLAEHAGKFWQVELEVTNGEKSEEGQ